MHSSFTVVMIIALISSAVIPAASGSPRKDRHVVCAAKILRTMDSLCNQRTDIDLLKIKAYECCKKNCDIIEMFSFCASRMDREDRESKESEEI